MTELAALMPLLRQEIERTTATTNALDAVMLVDEVSVELAVTIDGGSTGPLRLHVVDGHEEQAATVHHVTVTLRSRSDGGHRQPRPVSAPRGSFIGGAGLSDER